MGRDIGTGHGTWVRLLLFTLLSILVPVRCYGPTQWNLYRQHSSWLHLSISGISQLLPTQFWPIFKGRFLGPTLTDANCCGDICHVNICPCTICPYQECISCYWPNFDQTFLTQYFLGLTFLWTKILFDWSNVVPHVTSAYKQFARA